MQRAVRQALGTVRLIRADFESSFTSEEPRLTPVRASAIRRLLRSRRRHDAHRGPAGRVPLLLLELAVRAGKLIRMFACMSRLRASARVAASLSASARTAHRLPTRRRCASELLYRFVRSCCLATAPLGVYASRTALALLSAFGLRIWRYRARNHSDCQRSSSDPLNRASQAKHEGCGSRRVGTRPACISGAFVTRAWTG